MKESQKNLFKHSEVKVGLYRKYLSIYLNVLSRAQYVKEILLFDLFCGEGKYEDGGIGSPLATLQTIKDHYDSNNQICKNINILFNDTGKSEIEPNKLKIQRVKDFADEIVIPTNVNVHYREIDYNSLIKIVKKRTDNLKSHERALIFIDPWGYKEIDPQDIKDLLSNNKTEILLFLPIYFMSRFVSKSIKDDDFPGGKPLRTFLNKLFNGDTSSLLTDNTQKRFIYLIQEQFKKYTGLKYVDTFKIEREKGQWFCLFFLTPTLKGFEKMLESKWALDRKKGEGYKINDDITIELFDEIEVSGYKDKLINFIKNKNDGKGVTNTDLLGFGLENNFLKTHTKPILDEIKDRIELISLDGLPVKSYYLGDDKRKILIKMK